MERESEELLELVGKAEGHLGSVDRPLGASTGHDSAGERLLTTTVNLYSRSIFNIRDTPVPRRVLFP